MSLGRPEPPPRIIVCVNTGDWWDPAPPDNDVCPHPGCEGEHVAYLAGRAAATPDPPCAHGLTGGRGATERCFECGASVTAASPDERLREATDALATIYVILTGAEPMWAEMPVGERCARAANEAQQAFLSLDPALAAADREAPDGGR